MHSSCYWDLRLILCYFFQNFILTAGHCCYGGDADYSSIVAGEHDLGRNEGPEQVFNMLVQNSWGNNPTIPILLGGMAVLFTL